MKLPFLCVIQEQLNVSDFIWFTLVSSARISLVVCTEDEVAMARGRHSWVPNTSRYHPRHPLPDQVCMDPTHLGRWRLHIKCVTKFQSLKGPDVF